MDRRSFLGRAVLLPILGLATGCAGWEREYIDEAKDDRDRRFRRREVDRVEEMFDNRGGGY